MDAVKLEVPIEVLGSLNVSQLMSVVELAGLTVSPNLSSQARKKACLEVLSRNVVRVCPRDRMAEKFVARLRIRWYMKKVDSWDRILCKLSWVRWVHQECKKIIETLGVYVSRGSCEGVYQKALMHVLRMQGLAPCMERTVTLYYPPKPYSMSGMDAVLQKFGMVGTNRLDIEVQGWIIELKAVERTLTKPNLCQLINYLKHTEYTKGLLINFNQTTGRIEYLTCFES